MEVLSKILDKRRTFQIIVRKSLDGVYEFFETSFEIFDLILFSIVITVRIPYMEKEKQLPLVDSPPP